MKLGEIFNCYTLIAVENGYNLVNIPSTQVHLLIGYLMSRLGCAPLIVTLSAL